VVAEFQGPTKRTVLAACLRMQIAAMRAYSTGWSLLVKVGHVWDLREVKPGTWKVSIFCPDISGDSIGIQLWGNKRDEDSIKRTQSVLEAMVVGKTYEIARFAVVSLTSCKYANICLG
jgi:hypothetical protein